MGTPGFLNTAVVLPSQLTNSPRELEGLKTATDPDSCFHPRSVGIIMLRGADVSNSSLLLSWEIWH